LGREPSYEEVVGHAANRVEELFKEKGVSVAVLAGPGSSRLEVARRVPESVVVSYKLQGLEKLQEASRAEPLEFEGGKPLVGGKTLAEYVKEKSPARVIVVPESTIEAIKAYSLLRGRLGENNVALVFTPGVHREGLKKRSVEPPREAEVDCNAVFKAFKVKPEGGGRGLSLKLLQHHRTEKWERLRRGAEALRRLSPGRLGLWDALVNAGRRALSSLGESLAEELYAAAGGAAVASALAVLASPLGLPEAVAKVIGYVFPPKLLLEVARELFGATGGRPEREHVKRLAELVQAAIIAAEFVSDERLEGVADEVASQWGLSLKELRELVGNLRKLATQEVVTEDELKKLREEVKGDLEALEQRLRELFEQRIDQLEKGLEDRLEQLEKRVEELEKRVGRIEGQLRDLRALTGVYQEPGDLGFDLERGKFWVESKKEEYDLVTSGRFVEHAGKLLEALERGELVVVTGPRGVGKSVLARYALAKLLETGHWRVYEVETLDEKSAAAAVVKLGRAADSSPWGLAVLYDPSAPVYYEPGYELSPPPGVGPTVWALARLHRGQGGRVPVVVVLPEDLYEQVKGGLKGAHVLRLDLRQEDFLAGIVRAYSRGACNDQVYESIAGEITSKYEGGYTLVARYAGEWLSKAGECDEKAVRDALEAGAGSAEAFIALFIYEAVFEFADDPDFVRELLIPFIARAVLGPLPPKWLESFPVLRKEEGGYVVSCHASPLGRSPGEEEQRREKPALHYDKKGFIREWLPQRKEDIVEGVIKGIALGRFSGRLHELAGKELVSERVLWAVRSMEEGVKEVVRALRSASFDGECGGEDPVDVLFKALASDPELRELAKENSYHFAALVGLAHTLLMMKPFLDEVGFPEGLKGWLTVGGEVPFSARDFLVETAPTFRDVVNPCEVLNSIHQQAAKERGHKIIPASAALGALAISGGELEGCLDEATTATSLTFQEIPLLLWTLVSDSIMEVLKRFAWKLVGKGRWLEAVAIAYSAWRWDTTLASELLGLVEREAGGLERLDPLARTLYEETDYSARRAQGEGLEEWAGRVEAFLKGLEEDAVGLYARALLGARLASALRVMGSAGEALDWAGKARSALEQLKGLDRSKLAEDLKPLLKVKVPFSRPGEDAERLLADLEFIVLNEEALIELSVNAEQALEFTGKLHEVAEKLGPSELALSRLFRARAMLLAGRKREDVLREIRESWELAQDKIFIGFSKAAFEAITAEYVASFLLEGKPEETLEQYRKYVEQYRELGFSIQDPRICATLLALIQTFGVDQVRGEFENYRRSAIAHITPEPLRLPLFILSGEANVKETSPEHEIIEYMFEYGFGVPSKKYVYTLLRQLKWGRELEPHLEGLSALEILEMIVALKLTTTTLVEVVHQACVMRRTGLAKTLAECMQRELKEGGFTLAARLWGDLAKSLEGDCGKEFREALIRLFYLYV